MTGLGPYLAEVTVEPVERLADHQVARNEVAADRDHPEVAQTLRVRGHVNAAAGLHHEALADYRQGITMLDQVGAHATRSMLVLRSLEAESSAELGDDPAAQHAWREAARIAEVAFGETHAATFDARLDLIEYLLDRGEHTEAATQLDEVQRIHDAAGTATDTMRARLQAARTALASS